MISCFLFVLEMYNKAFHFCEIGGLLASECRLLFSKHNDIVQNYYPLQDHKGFPGGFKSAVAFAWVELGTLSIFCFDFLLVAIASPSAWAYICSEDGVVDILSLLPLIRYIVRARIPGINFLTVLRSLKILRLVRFTRFRLEQYSSSRNAMILELLKTVWGFIVIIFIATGVFHTIEILGRDPDPDITPAFTAADLEWHDTLYFVVVTMSTVGCVPICGPRV